MDSAHVEQRNWEMEEGEGQGQKDNSQREVNKIKIDRVKITRIPATPPVPVISTEHSLGAGMYDFVMSGKMYMFKVLQVFSPTNFYMEYIHERPANEFSSRDMPGGDGSIVKGGFWNDLQQLYRMEDFRNKYPMKTEPLRRRMYVAELHDEDDPGRPSSWERMVIVDKNVNTRRVDVLLIDEGRRKNSLKFEQLYELPSIFSDEPSRGFECYLSDVVPENDDDAATMNWSPEVCKRFEEMVRGKRVQAYVRGKSVTTFPDTNFPKCKIGVTIYVLGDKPGPASLALANESINAQLIQKRYAGSKVGWLERLGRL